MTCLYLYMINSILIIIKNIIKYDIFVFIYDKQYKNNNNSNIVNRILIIIVKYNKI